MAAPGVPVPDATQAPPDSIQILSWEEEGPEATGAPTQNGPQEHQPSLKAARYLHSK